MIKLKMNDRIIKYFRIPKDITVIEIKESDEIYKEVEFINYDLNNEKKGSILD